MKAIILAGGKGTRLAPYTKILPKPLMPVGDMPILEIILRQLAQEGFDEVILTVGHLAELLRAFFGNGEKLGLRLTYSIEDRPLGTVGPLALLSGLDETFLVMNGDILTDLKYRTLVGHHRQSGALATIATHVRREKIDFGVLYTGPQGQVLGYQEKPVQEYQVSMGVYVFEPPVLQHIPANGYLDLPDLVLALLSQNLPVNSYRFEGYWQDLGRLSDYETAIADFERLRPSLLPDLENPE